MAAGGITRFTVFLTDRFTKRGHLPAMANSQADSVLGRLAAWYSCRRGGVATMFALGLPLAAVAGGFSIETTYWFYRDLELQSAADASAFAAALEKRAGSDLSKIESIAKLAAQDNGFDPASDVIVVNSPPTTGQFQHSDAVEVVLTSTAQRFFTALFMSSDVGIESRSVAVYTTAQDACVLALSPSASKAADFAGAADLNLSGCSVMANSMAADAINVQGSATLSTDCLISVGGVRVNSSVTMTQCSSPIVDAPPVADPFSAIPAPERSGSCKNTPHNPTGPYTLSPGQYCKGMSISGTASLEPGVYYIDGDFDISANSSLTGAGVTLYITGSGRVTVNGNATVNLQAPSSGPYAGMLFFGDRANSSGGTNRFNGTAGSSMTGAIYFAAQAIEYSGNFSGVNGCTQVVGRTVQWSGRASLSVDCSAHGLKKIPAYSIVKLAE